MENNDRDKFPVARVILSVVVLVIAIVLIVIVSAFMNKGSEKEELQTENQITSFFER